MKITDIRVRKIAKEDFAIIYVTEEFYQYMDEEIAEYNR